MAAAPAHPSFKTTTTTTLTTPGTPINDRFIVNRSSANFELSHYYLLQSKRPPATLEQRAAFRHVDSNCLPSRSSMSLAKKGEAIRRRLLFETCTCEPAGQQQRVLKFSNKRSQNASQNRIMTSSQAQQQQHRPIVLGHETALDAPGVVNDFYLHLMDWSAKGVLAVGLKDDVYLWDHQKPAKDAQAIELAGPEASSRQLFATAVRFNHDGCELAVADSCRRISIWDPIARARSSGVAALWHEASYASSLAWNQRILACGNKDGSIVFWDTRSMPTGQAKSTGVISMAGSGLGCSQICGLEWDITGRYLASGTDDGLVDIWDVRYLASDPSQAPVYSIRAHAAAAKALDWCPWQSNLLATGGGMADPKIKIWNVYNQKELCQVNTGSQVSGLRWSEENRELVSSHGEPDFELSLWKYPMMSKIADLRGHSDRVLAVCKSANNQYIASLGADETLRLWNCLKAKPKPVASLGETPISSRYMSQNFHIR